MSNLRDSQRFQFGLRSLLWVMTGFAVLCSALTTCSWQVRYLLVDALGRVAVLALAFIGAFFLAIVVGDMLGWIKTADANGLGPRQKLAASLFRRQFWIVVLSAFPIATCLNFIPYCFSYGADQTDGYEVMGWPLTFFQRGGFSYSEQLDQVALIVDLFLSMVIAVIVGIGFRDGTGPLIARGRKLIKMIRIWPQEDDA